jgi:hypothetical protein
MINRINPMDMTLSSSRTDPDWTGERPCCCVHESRDALSDNRSRLSPAALQRPEAARNRVEEAHELVGADVKPRPAPKALEGAPRRVLPGTHGLRGLDADEAVCEDS